MQAYVVKVDAVSIRREPVPSGPTVDVGGVCVVVGIAGEGIAVVEMSPG